MIKDPDTCYSAAYTTRKQTAALYNLGSGTAGAKQRIRRPSVERAKATTCRYAVQLQTYHRPNCSHTRPSSRGPYATHFPSP